jgi:prevent-host-death family protein
MIPGGDVARLISKRQSARGEPEGPPARRWQLQTAKARFSELFRRARLEGPQWVTRQDKEAVVVLPAEEFERLRTRSRQPKSLVEFFAKSPLSQVRIDLERKPDYGRAVEL